jgi:predicted transcriptional regulator
MGIVTIQRKGRKLNLLGKVHPADETTFSALYNTGKPLSASQLAKTLKININAMNERLTKLTSLGVVRREKTSSQAGREQYVYHILG